MTQNTPFMTRAKRLTEMRLRGLRITPEYFTKKETFRKALFPDGVFEGYSESEEDTVFNVIKLQQLYPKLYQEHPEEKSTYKPPNGGKHRCFTNSYESYKNKANMEVGILKANNRLPIYEMVLHLLEELMPKEIIKLRTKAFRYLKEHGIEAVTAIELTRGKNDMPNNRVHFHILTDDPRSKKELEELLIKACESKAVGLIRDKDFTVRCRELPEPEKYFNYFTKRSRTDKDWCKLNNKKRVLLFVKGTGLQKFNKIGKWFKKTKKKLWKEFLEKTYTNLYGGKKSKKNNR